MVITLKVNGPGNISAAFDDFAQTMIRHGLQEPVDKAFKQGEQVARSKAPVRTGFLRSSIRVDKSPSSTKLAL